MPYLIVKHKVKDFNQWLAVFESHAEAQKEAGFGGTQILRDYKNPNTVICLFKVLDIVKARAFTQAPDNAGIMEQAGIIGTPKALWLDELLVTLLFPYN